MCKNRDGNGNYGKVINHIVGWVGIAGIAFGVIAQIYCVNIIGTILLSVGASVFATAVVTGINAKYMLKTQHMEELISKWLLHGIYETKSEMNIPDANDALQQCSDSIDIIAEGMYNYIAKAGDVLKDKILHNGVRVRIISCDAINMLKLRARDEIGVECSGDDAVYKVKKLDQWVQEIRGKLGENKDNLQIRYHSSYPGLSYLRIDTMSFVSANLWKKPSQQCFAVSFKGNGKGDVYFKKYFQELWEDKNFVHERCKL